MINFGLVNTEQDNFFNILTFFTVETLISFKNIFKNAKKMLEWMM